MLKGKRTSHAFGKKYAKVSSSGSGYLGKIKKNHQNSANATLTMKCQVFGQQVPLYNCITGLI